MRKKYLQQLLQFLHTHLAIPEEIYVLAKISAVDNPYHHFEHELFVAESCYHLAQESHFSLRETEVLVTAALFHDAGYRIEWRKNKDLERLSAQILAEKVRPYFSEEEIQWMQQLILATKFLHRKRFEQESMNIIQDADLSLLGKGPYVFLFGSMGIFEENTQSINDFFQIEEQFLQCCTKNRQIFFSHAAQNLYIAPQDSLDTIKTWGLKVVQRAYEWRKKDIDLDTFTQKINKML